VSRAAARRVETPDGQVRLLALTSSTGQPRGFALRGETASGALVALAAPASWSWCRSPTPTARQVGVGDELELFTTGGWRSFEIGAVFQDYGSDSGTVILPLASTPSCGNDPGCRPWASCSPPMPMRRAPRRRSERCWPPLNPPASVQTNRGIRALSLEIFDRTFTITEVLRLLAIGVAFVGILSALMALELERAKDYAVLRATGMTRGQLRDG
jgi:putative ABC transport system permease protein